MNRLPFCFSLALVCAFGFSASAQTVVERLTGDDVLSKVRSSYMLYDREFTGQLRVGLAKKVPFRLVLKPDSIQYHFQSPNQVIYLDTQNKGFSLKESIGGGEFKPVTPDRFVQTLRGTDATYDDLSMRFIYWPNARLMKEGKFKGMDAYMVRVANPDGRGPYAMVDCWVDKASGGLIKTIGYNKKQRAISQTEVLSGKNFGDVWMVSEMRIESLSAGGKTTSSTRLQIREMVK